MRYAVVISVGSGKCGVGKSIISTNVGYLLAESGFSAGLIDMDSGGADLPILTDHFQSRYTMKDIIEGRVDSLDQIAEPLDGF